jgi:hypothetical protein
MYYRYGCLCHESDIGSAVTKAQNIQAPSQSSDLRPTDFGSSKSRAYWPTIL